LHTKKAMELSDEVAPTASEVTVGRRKKSKPQFGGPCTLEAFQRWSRSVHPKKVGKKKNVGEYHRNTRISRRLTSKKLGFRTARRT